ncbi:hypothetical protein A6279_00960 [Bacillus wiedmannii]|uniref:hypothetical protein n=1 Tax=Bacillus TaxID=1386 RepID=UPI0007DB0DDA|nr:hypothetical protein [Bacillus wiedmannii]OAK10921.1 hypothetical protein A6278_04080 [Bacillus wiedmannii]OAK11446.1 hypothetical protein A6279_00960 [Bacillus wiedmannii]
MNKYTTVGRFGGIKNDSLVQIGEQAFSLVLKHRNSNLESKILIDLEENIINYGLLAEDYDQLTKPQQAELDQELRSFIKRNKAFVNQ